MHATVCLQLEWLQCEALIEPDEGAKGRRRLSCSTRSGEVLSGSSAPSEQPFAYRSGAEMASGTAFHCTPAPPEA